MSGLLKMDNRRLPMGTTRWISWVAIGIFLLASPGLSQDDALTSRTPAPATEAPNGVQNANGNGGASIAPNVDATTPADDPSPAVEEQRLQADRKAPFARRIRVSLPIVGSADLMIKRMIQQSLEQIPSDQELDDRPILVLEFWPPDGSEGGGSEFERSLALARFLISPELRRVRTVAYIPRAVTGHAVLVAMACEEIMMSGDATLGLAGAGESSIGPTMRGGYTEIAGSRRTIPEALALGMLDAELTVSRVETSQGVLYAWTEEVEKLKNERNDLQAITTISGPQRPAKYRGDQLREWEIVSHLASSSSAVADVLGVSSATLDLNPSLGGTWKAIRVELSGPISAQQVSRVQRTIEQQRDRADVNFVCIELNSPGGSLADSMRLANYLASLEPGKIRTVAYVPQEARGDAVLIAAACDHLIVHTDSILGGGGGISLSDEEVSDVKSPIQRLAQDKGRSWSLLAAMFDSELTVHRYKHVATGDVQYLSDEELRERFGKDVEPGNAVLGWEMCEALNEQGELLELTGQRAVELQMARVVVDNFEQLASLYQLSGDLEKIGPNWAFDLIDGLASPQLAGILLFIGVMALLAELSSPGVGVGGFISALCFLLFFWSKHLHGTAEVLEVMLFLTGLAFLVLELLVLPGFGLFGFGGLALMVASLVLASQTFVWPTNDYQWDQLSRSMQTMALIGGAVFASLLMLRKHFHRLPLFGRVMLLPPDGEDRQEWLERESLVDYRDLLHQVGTTRTPLLPSGKALIDNRLVDVISDGEVIEKNCRIRVVEVTGNRIVVRQV